ASEDSAVRARHLAYFTSVAERAYANAGRVEPTLFWLDRLEMESDNFHAALSWARNNDRATFLRLAGALSVSWWLRAAHLREGREWLTTALGTGAPHGSALARALTGASLLASWQGDPGAALTLAERSLAEWQAIDAGL